MKVLLVEDEEHKANDLSNRIMAAGFSRDSLFVAASVREAVLLVIDTQFDLIVLDMALPTLNHGSDDGVSIIEQLSGGVEILRALESCGRSTSVLIVTQYPEITINGERIRPTKVASVIRKLYNQNVIGVVTYSYKTPEWESAFDKAIKIVK